jgi:hypothetical protein
VERRNLPVDRWDCQRVARVRSEFDAVDEREGKNVESRSVSIAHLDISHAHARTHVKSYGRTSDTNHGIAFGLVVNSWNMLGPTETLLPRRMEYMISENRRGLGRCRAGPVSQGQPHLSASPRNQLLIVSTRTLTCKEPTVIKYNIHLSPFQPLNMAPHLIQIIPKYKLCLFSLCSRTDSLQLL